MCQQKLSLYYLEHEVIYPRTANVRTWVEIDGFYLCRRGKYPSTPVALEVGILVGLEAVEPLSSSLCRPYGMCVK